MSKPLILILATVLALVIAASSACICVCLGLDQLDEIPQFQVGFAGFVARAGPSIIFLTIVTTLGRLTIRLFSVLQKPVEGVPKSVH